MYTCMHAQSCPTLCYLMDWRPPGSSVHEISQVRIGNGLPFPIPKKCTCVCKSPDPSNQKPPMCVQGCHSQVSGQTTFHAPFLHDRHPDVWSRLIEGSLLHFLGPGLCHWHLKASWCRGVLSISLFLWVKHPAWFHLPLKLVGGKIPSLIRVQAVSRHLPCSGVCKASCSKETCRTIKRQRKC